jgi:hypothetical protein
MSKFAPPNCERDIDEAGERKLPLFLVLDLIHAAQNDGNFRWRRDLGNPRVVGGVEAVKVPYQRMAYVSGSEVTKKKPDPQIFLIAASRLGLEAARCVVFEDAPSGVQAARAAGAKCIAVTNTVPAEKLSGADVICDSLEKVNLKMIQTIIG